MTHKSSGSDVTPERCQRPAGQDPLPATAQEFVDAVLNRRKPN